MKTCSECGKPCKSGRCNDCQRAINNAIRQDIQQMTKGKAVVPKYILTNDLDVKERRHGFTTELIDLQHDTDHGPVAIAWFRNRVEAEKILRALQLSTRL